MTDTTRIPGEVADLAEPVTPSLNHSNSQSVDEETNTAPVFERKIGEVDEDAERVVDQNEKKTFQDFTLKAQENVKPWQVLLYVSIFMFSCWAVYDYSMYVTEVYRTHLLAGVFLFVVGVMLLLSIIWVVSSEYKAWKRFDALAHRNAALDSAVKNNDLQLVKDTLSDTLNNIKLNNPAVVSQFESASLVNETAEQYLQQVENIVLLPLDGQVDAIIKKSALAAGASVFIIPHPALDALAVTWHSLILSKKIAAIYGMNPSGLSSIRLFKYILSSAVFAASAQIVSDVVAEELGRSTAESAGEILFGSVFSKVGEGAVTVWRMYRLGRIVRLTVRPGK